MGRHKAGGRGFEPRHMDSESTVLPLDEPPVENVAILPPTTLFVKLHQGFALQREYVPKQPVFR